MSFLEVRLVFDLRSWTAFGPMISDFFFLRVVFEHFNFWCSESGLRAYDFSCSLRVAFGPVVSCVLPVSFAGGPRALWFSGSLDFNASPFFSESNFLFHIVLRSSFFLSLNADITLEEAETKAELFNIDGWGLYLSSWDRWCDIYGDEGGFIYRHLQWIQFGYVRFYLFMLWLYSQ